jgi:O-antigen/teichoic acid export membrane protein
MPLSEASPPVPVDSLGKRARHAALWVGAAFALTQAVRLGSSIVLTRLLAPEMYGLMTIGSVIIAAVVMMTDYGFSQSVIHNKRGDDPKFLNTIWTMQIGRGVALSLLLGLAALGLAAVNAFRPGWLVGSYAHPKLPAVIGMLSLVPLLAGLESTNLARAQRVLAMGQLVRNEFLVQVAVTALLIWLASHYPSYWVLPLGWLLLAGGVTALSHINLPGPRNALGWDRSAAVEAWHYSKWILVSSLLTYLFREGDRILLGVLVDPQTLGIYAVGVLLVNAARDVIYRLAVFVGMPALAEVARERPQGLREMYRKCRWPIDAMCVIGAGFLFAAAHRIIGLIYDGRYSAAGNVLSMLALGLIAFRYTVMEQYLIATGETRQLFKRGVVQNLTMYTMVPLGFYLFGMKGALIGIVLAQSSVIPVMLKVQHDRGLLDWRFELGTLLMFPAGWLLGRLVG